MKFSKFLFSFFFPVVFFNPAFSQSVTNSSAPNNNMEWWRDARFGMFIHWGLYAVPAGEWNGKTDYGEWIRNSAQIPLNTYDVFRSQFNPTEFDAEALVKMARDAGMKYIVITSKHHEGFCMFNTKQTDFCITNTPFKHDPLKDLSAACKKYGLKFCIYYSIMDWHHPDYLPRREWEKDRSSDGADFNRYVQYMKAQLKELLTNYGDIGILWFDGQWESTWNIKYGREIYDYVKALQPHVIVNNRVGAGRLDLEGFSKQDDFGGDYNTPEQLIPASSRAGVDWETCMTMNDHWGYNKADKNFKSSKEIIQMLAEVASKGGNYLLNVGPTSLGTIPQESIIRLDSIGKWMKVNGEAIYGTTAGPFKSIDWGFCSRKETKNGTILFLHIFNWPKERKLTIHGVLNRPIKALLLADPLHKELEFSSVEDALVIKLPANAPDPNNSVVLLQLSGELDYSEAPLIESGYDYFVDSLTFSISSAREKDEIKYTLDGTEPIASSTHYTSPLAIYQSTVVNARCFQNGKPVSGISVREFLHAQPHLADTLEKEKVCQGIRYKYFEGVWTSLPDLSKMKPVKDGLLNDFSLSQRTKDDYFVFTYTGYILIPEKEVYRFYTESDDDSNLYINDSLVVKNEGMHGSQERSGTIALEKGYHKIQLNYMERTGNESLNIYVDSQKMKKQKLPESWLFSN